MKKLINFSIEHPVSILMILAGIILCSVVSLFKIKYDFLPIIPDRYLLVSTTYEGLPAEEIKKLITVPIEDSITSLKGVKNISSVSRDGISLVTVEMHWNNSINVSLTECKSLIDECFETLPSGCQKPEVKVFNPNQNSTITISITPKDGDLRYCKYITEEDIKPRFQRLSEVSLVTLTGGEDDEIHIILDKNKAEGHFFTIDSIAQSISQNNFEYPAGTIKEGNSEYVLKTSALFTSLDSIAKLPISFQEEGMVRLEDIALVKNGIKDKDTYFYNGEKESLCLYIFKKNDQSPLTLSRNVKKELTKLNESYGSYFTFEILDDQSTELISSIRQLLLSALCGILITILILLIFFKSVKISFTVASIIPLNIIFSILVLSIFGKTINVMSLTGIALGIGMIIDPTIVTVESIIAQKNKQNENYLLNGSAAVVSSSIGSTLTTVIVFIPLYFLSGLTGKLFTDLSIAVISTMIFSCILSFTYIPAVIGLFINNHSKKELSLTKIEQFYNKSLLKIFNKKIIIPLTLTLLALLTAILIYLLPKEILSNTRTNKLNLKIQYPVNSSLEKISNDAQNLSSYFNENTIIDSFYINIGIDNSNFQVLANPEERKETMTISFITSKPEKLIEYLNSFMTNLKLKYTISTNDNYLSSILNIQKNMYRIVQETPELLNSDIDDLPYEITKTIPDSKRNEYAFTPDRNASARFAVTSSFAAQTLFNNLEGVIASNYYTNGREIPIRIKYQDNLINSQKQLEDILIISGNNYIPLKSVGAISIQEKENILYRYGKKDCKLLTISGPINNNKLVSIEKEQINELFGNITFLLLMIILLLYCIMGAQFESFIIPIAILISIAPAFFGAFFNLFIFSKTINLNSLMALVVLFGTSVNNSIILYESIITEEITQNNVIKNSVTKLKSIVITSLTSICALIPFAIDPLQKNAQSSMSVAIIGGLLASLIIVLLFIPPILEKFLKRNSK